MKSHLFAATCTSVLVLIGSSQGKTQDTRSAKAVLEAYISAWNRHDSAALDKILTPDAVHEDIAWGSREEGPVQIKGLMNEMIKTEPDFQWRLTTIVDGGTVVAAEWTWTSTYTGDSPIGHLVRRHCSGRGASVAVLANGRIKRFNDYYDFARVCSKPPPADAAQSNK